MNFTFLSRKCTSASLLLHSRLVTRVYYWKRRWFVGLRTSETGGLWSSCCGWLLKLWDLKRKDHLANSVEEIRVWSSVSQLKISHWICNMLSNTEILKQYFFWCLIGFPWHASHHELCCSEPHSRQCVQTYINEQTFKAICVNVNFNIIKERKIPFLKMCIYIYVLGNAPWYTLTYLHTCTLEYTLP